MHYRDQSLALLAIGTILMIGCDSPQTIKPIDVTSTSKQTQSDAPSWIDNPPGALSAIGFRELNVLGDKMFQRRMATNQARVELAFVFKAQVKGMIQQSATENYMGSKDNTPNTTKLRSSTSALNSSLTRLSKTVDENTVDIELSGAAARQFWTDKETGDLYVLVQIDEESALAKVKAAARAAVEKERILAEKELTDKTLAEDMKVLDERIQKIKELPPASSLKGEGSQN